MFSKNDSRCGPGAHFYIFIIENRTPTIDPICVLILTAWSHCADPSFKLEAAESWMKDGTASQHEFTKDLNLYLHFPRDLFQFQTHLRAARHVTGAKDPSQFPFALSYCSGPTSKSS